MMILHGIIIIFSVSIKSALTTRADSNGYKKTLQEESMSVTRTSSVPEILREAVDSGWLDKKAVDTLQNKQTHKVEGYFMSSDTTVSGDEKKIGLEALQLHNVFRLIHHSPPLRWSNALETAAKHIARQLAEQNAQIRDEIPDNAFNQSDINFRVFQMRSRLPIPSDQTYGENAIKISDVPYHCDYGIQEATKRWYNQGKQYSFSSPQVEKKTSSFTQVIWKKSRQLGVGCAERKGLLTHDLYVVALYNPAGNSLADMRDNVQRPGETKDVYGDIN